MTAWICANNDLKTGTLPVSACEQNTRNIGQIDLSLVLPRADADTDDEAAALLDVYPFLLQDCQKTMQITLPRPSRYWGKSFHFSSTRVIQLCTRKNDECWYIYIYMLKIPLTVTAFIMQIFIQQFNPRYTVFQFTQWYCCKTEDTTFFWMMTYFSPCK